MSATARDPDTGKFATAEPATTVASSTTAEPTEPASFTAEDAAKLRSEAGKYRLRAKDAEAQVVGLQRRVDAHDKAAVERIASEHLADPADVFLAHPDLSAFRDEDGSLDADRVREMAVKVAAAHPHWRPPPPDFSAGVRRALPQSGGFGDALKAIANGR